MTPTDIGHGRGWLDAPAAASVKRIDGALGRPLDVNSAGRTYAEQQEKWDAYQNGTGAPANKPGHSVHEYGLALDTDDRPAFMAEHGWWRPYDYEPWHYEYIESNDKHRADEAPTQEEDEMPIFIEDTQGDRGRAVIAGGEFIPLANGTEIKTVTNPKRGLEKWYVETAEFDSWKNIFGRAKRNETFSDKQLEQIRAAVPSTAYLSAEDLRAALSGLVLTVE